ncbi:hypothetical protein RUND412_006371 [Rhizina undulata]
MILLASLATEILIAIVECLDEPEDFATFKNRDDPPPLKSLARTCRRLYAICFPFLFKSIRLRLHAGQAHDEIDQLREFLRRCELKRSVENVAISLGDEWNSGKIGLELKKFLWELSVKSLSLHRPNRFGLAVRERSAKWSYFLDSIERLRVCTIDDNIELNMLLLRQCPAKLLHVDDGDFRSQFADDSHIRRDPHQQPAIALMKPSVFPNLSSVVYYATWPSYVRFENFLRFVDRLPSLRELMVTLMGGKNEVLEFRNVDRYKPYRQLIPYREMVLAYRILSTSADANEKLKRLVVGDVHQNPFHGDTLPPASFKEVALAVYERID